MLLLKVFMLLSLPGKDRDVGEVLVKSLQNTKYSIDEKLEKSFITLFNRNPIILPEAQSDAKHNHETVKQIRDIEPLKQNEIDDEDLDCSESSDQDEAAKNNALISGEGGGPNEEYGNAPKQQANLQDLLKEQIEFHDGRLRRKVIFDNDTDDNSLEVINAVSCYVS